jgi:hypothetical protein
MKPYKVTRDLYKAVKIYFNSGYTPQEVFGEYSEDMETGLSLTTLRKIKLSKNYKAYCNLNKKTYNKPRVTVYTIEHSIFKPKEGLFKRLAKFMK